MTGGLNIFASISLCAVLLALAGCTDSPGAHQASSASGALERPQNTSAVPVVVAKIERGSVPIELHAIGTGQAFKTVSVESQVAGIVKEVHYRPGEFVRKGDLLVTLDDAPFRAALSQAEAALARDQAQAHLNQSSCNAMTNSQGRRCLQGAVRSISGHVCIRRRHRFGR